MVALSEAELREEEQRKTITEVLYFASRGNVARMKMIIAHRRVNVRLPTCHSSTCGLLTCYQNTIWTPDMSCRAVEGPQCLSLVMELCLFPTVECTWYALKTALALLQVKSPSCCDYDRRTPL